ncbi:Glycosyltransferase involved in cell wall bisynthesis [Parasphingorhabdus marina DSM 22363]|uniref:Glycosyltransferase involved in cell wall bisynthesis n=1 Tax=Parasphingorhabdus marina DSM 22363 TaxID=1123272 RepID=A0A1N6CPK1_9SPHN|nr:glycosyltransferase family 4 protein [Parasphingorhabdus marina]SIN60498.1 Glycosyltransferase involved in cell wall bisynthesis [Parasphingorhabdus marina DSM 22363]
MTGKLEQENGQKTGGREPLHAGTIGYLTSQYPAASHTFIRREIEQLRSGGLPIKTYSIRRPETDLASAADQRMREETYYVLNAGIGAYVVSHLRALFTRPLRYLSCFTRAMRHRVPGLRALIWALFHFAESIVLARQLEKDGVGHLHNHFANSAATVGMLASRFNKIPWSLTLHGISETDYPAGLLLADKIAEARFVACVSWFGRAQAMRIVPVRVWDKFHIVRCGITLDELPRRSEPNGERTRKQIICVARLSSEKGHPGLLQAFAGLVREGHDVELLLVGDGPAQAEIQAQCDELAISDRVKMAGRLSEQDTLAAIAGSDILVLPSFMEGLPVVLMEGMALGKPVVASRIAGVPELIDDEHNGLLFHPADWDGLRRALDRTLSDAAGASKRAERARVKISEEFDVKIAVSPLPELFANAKQAGAPLPRGEQP